MTDFATVWLLTQLWEDYTLDTVAKKSAYKTPPEIARPTRLRRSPSRNGVTRAEYNNIIEALNQKGEIINDVRRELEVQFKRMAQMQSELDELRRASLKS